MPQSVIDQHQRNNFFQTMLLLMAMTAILCLAGLLLYGQIGVLVAVGLLAFGVFFSPRLSTALLMRHYKAQRITREQAPALIQLLEEISQAGKIEPPPLYYIPTSLPNAFAGGVGKESFVAVTDGLLRMMNHRELAGVIAHEVAHILNHDIRVLGTADTITRTASMFSRIGIFLLLFSGVGSMFGISIGGMWFGGLVLLLAPALLMLLQLAISRTREFDADLGAAELTGDPMGLASALYKLNPPKSKSFFERIFRPGPRRTQPAMLRTHPPTEQRVARLMELESIKQEGLKDREAAAERRIRESIAGVPSESGFVTTHPPVTRKPRYHPTNGLWY